MKLENSIYDFDVIVIGGGAAGISSALWCDELDLRTLLLEKNAELGGQLLHVYNPVKNHLGTEADNGRELRDIFVRQIKNRRFTVRLSSAAAKIDAKNSIILLENGETLRAKMLIIAAGVRRRTLNIRGEKRLRNKGIIESGKRDQHLTAGKTAVVVGGGDAAFENALILAETAATVTLIHRNPNFRARPEFIEQVKNNARIKILTSTTITEIIGNEKVEAVKLNNLQTNETHILPVEIILVRIGVTPNTELFDGQISLDKNGYIKVNHNCQTDLPNIFAVGDVANPLSPTVSTAIGTGATAGKVIIALSNL